MALPPCDFTDLSAGERFLRQEMIEGWSQDRMASSRVLVAGAGALGNEVLKNLALLGVGTVGVIDFDKVEESNLSRCALFSHRDMGRPKALAAAERVAALNLETKTLPFVCDLQHDVGAGLLEEFDLVLGCVDNIGARWKLNRLSRRAGVSWIDAGIDAFCGQVARYDPDAGACYECGMTDSMWQRMLERRSCLLPGNNVIEPAVAATVLVASLTAALQVQEAAAALMAETQLRPWPRLAAGERLSVRVNPYEMAVLKTRVREGCLTHAQEDGIAVPVGLSSKAITVDDLLRACDGCAVYLDWEVADGLECPLCGIEEVAVPEWKLTAEMLRCAACERQRRPRWVHAVARGERLANGTLTSLGVPEKAHLRVQLRGSEKFMWCRID